MHSRVLLRTTLCSFPLLLREPVLARTSVLVASARKNYTSSSSRVRVKRPQNSFARKSSTMTTPMEAHCNCGTVEVKITKPGMFDKPNGHLCHCINCQKTAGSVYGTNLAIESKYVEIKGEDNLSVYKDYDTLNNQKLPEGEKNPVYRYFCKTCGNSIKSETDAASKNGMVILKLGIFRQIPTPEMEAFTDTRHPWLPALDGAKQFPGPRG